jgi:integrase
MLCGMDEKAFYYMISRLGRELYPTLGETLSPYCIRHQYATDLKAAGWEWGEIATALGQKTDKCTSVYGRARGKSDGSLVPTKVGAEAMPLEKRTAPGLARRNFDLEFGP